MTAISGLTACLLGNVLFALAPVPPEAPPDPMGRGYMGIRVQSGGLAIESVEPGMPAAKSGLQGGDTILRIGTLEPREFDQVVSHICSFRPGAVVEIEVQRGDQRRTFKVKLACRPAELDQPTHQPRPIDVDD